VTAAPISISRSAVRRYLLARLGLSPSQPWRDELSGTEGVMAALQRLESIQLDPVSVVGRNQMLALLQRVADPGDGLDTLLEQGKLFECLCPVRMACPIDDYPYYRVRMRQKAAEWAERIDAIGGAAQHVIAELEREWPQPSRALDNDERVSGWWDPEDSRETKATRLALDLLELTGKVSTVRRVGVERYFALPEQVYPVSLLAAGDTISDADWRDFIVAKYLRGHVVTPAVDARFGWIHLPIAERRRLLADWAADGRVMEFAISGVRRPYYAMRADGEALLELAAKDAAGQAGAAWDEVAATGRVRDAGTEGPVFILPPLDNLLFHRQRLVELFDFAYTWEVYTPQPKRRYGPYTMPLLAGERFIGRFDSRLDREAGTLWVNILEFEPELRPGARLKKAVRGAVATFAKQLGAQRVSVAGERVALKLE
jgi:uncharacterized protein YcaQ